MVTRVTWFVIWTPRFRSAGRWTAAGCRVVPAVVPSSGSCWSTFVVNVSCAESTEDDARGETEFCLVLARCVFVHSDNLPQHLLAVVAVIFCGRLAAVALGKWPLICVCGHLSHVTGEVIPLTLSVGGLVSSGGSVAASGTVPCARTHVSCGIESRPVGVHGRRRPAVANSGSQPQACELTARL